MSPATAVQSNSRKAPNRPSGTAPLQVVPFTAAAHEHNEPGGFDFTVTPTAVTQQFGPFDVPAFGYLRHIWILVETTAAGTGGTLGPDAPFNLFQEISLIDVNGGPIFGPLTGYQTFLVNAFGAYAFRSDPRKAPDYNAATTTFTFLLRIPVEINHNNGLGALSNQNASSSYKVRLVINTIANVWSGGAPSPAPTFRISSLLEAWTQPNAIDIAGRQCAVAPPSHGTTQMWSQTSKGLVTGDNTIQFTRMGNLIRNWILVFRNSSGVRQAVANLPDPLQINWDTRQMYYERKYHRRAYMAERIDIGADVLWDGVLLYGFAHDVIGHQGDGTPELFWPTLQSSRIEFHSSAFPAALGGGTVEVITNDIAPVEVNPAARYDEQSQTGFHPAGVGTVQTS